MPAIAREPSGTAVLGVVRAAASRTTACARRAVDVRAPASARSLASIMREPRVDARRDVGRRTPSFFSRLAIALAMSAGVRSALARSSQFWLGFGMAPFAAGAVALALVELAEHVRAARRRASCRALPSAGTR